MGWEELIDTVDGKEIRSTEKMDIYEERRYTSSVPISANLR